MYPVHFTRVSFADSISAADWNALCDTVENLQRLEAFAPLTLVDTGMGPQLLVDIGTLLRLLDSYEAPSGQSGGTVTLDLTQDGKTIVLNGTTAQTVDLPASPPTGYSVTLVNPITAPAPATVTPPAAVGIGGGIPGKLVVVNPGTALELAFDGDGGDWKIEGNAPLGPVAQGPGVPTGITATPGNAQATVSWTAPTGSPSAASYNVYLSLSAAGPWNFATNTASTSTIITGLTNGTTYYVAVQALSSVFGTSPLPAAVSATPALPAGGAVGQTNSNYAFAASINVAWSGAIGTGDNRYVALYSQGSALTVTPPAGYSLVTSHSDSFTNDSLYLYGLTNSTATGAGHVDTFSWTGSHDVIALGLTVTGSLVGTVDQTSTADSGSGTTTTASVGTTSPTTQANEYVVVAFGAQDSTPATPITFSLPTNGFTIEISKDSPNNAATNRLAATLLFKTLSATGTVTAGATLSAACVTDAVLATLKN